MISSKIMRTKEGKYEQRLSRKTVQSTIKEVRKIQKIKNKPE